MTSDLKCFSFCEKSHEKLYDFILHYTSQRERMRYNEIKILNAAGLDIACDELMMNVIKETLDWIDNNLLTPINVVILAKRSGYSKWYFQRRFKEFTGRGLAEHLRVRRAEEALKFIMFTNDRMIDIAERFSFTSQQAFSRLIHCHFGMTPSELRHLPDFVRRNKSPL